MSITSDFLRLSLTRRSLGRFASAVMSGFEVAPHTALMVEHLERLIARKIPKLAIIEPPRHGKSLLDSVMTPHMHHGELWLGAFRDLGKSK